MIFSSINMIFSLLFLFFWVTGGDLIRTAAIDDESPVFSESSNTISHRSKDQTSDEIFSTEILSRQLMSSESNNFAPKIVEVQRILDDISSIVSEIHWDEKIWVDRPLKSAQPKDLDPLIKILKHHRDSIKKDASNINSVKEKSELIAKELDNYFYPIAHEVKVWEFGPNYFKPIANSALKKGIDKLSDNVLSQIRIKNMALDALAAYSQLYREFRPVTMQNELSYAYKEKILSIADQTDTILRTAKYLWDKGHYLDPKLRDMYSSTHLSETRALFRGRSSLIPMPYPVIVPGDRYGEAYYWDSYWVARGFIAAGKVADAKYILSNFFSCIDRFGFIPNGFRTYYLDRSQPPMLGEIVSLVYQRLIKNEKKDEALILLEQALPRLLKEYLGFWMNPALGHVVVLDKQNSIVPQSVEPLTAADILKSDYKLMNRYYSNVTEPRPESYSVDEKVMKALPESQRGEVEKAIRAAAESGWDFSSRWSRRFIMGETSPSEIGTYISTTKFVSEKKKIEFFLDFETQNLLPVDLNAILYKLERFISKAAFHLRESERYKKLGPLIQSLKIISEKFNQFANKRATTMTELMFDRKGLVWRDYYLTMKRQSRVISAASIVPLWAGLSNHLEVPIHQDLLKGGWGIVPTKFYTGHQWDSPNVWPPLLHFAVDYLASRLRYMPLSNEIDNNRILSSSNRHSFLSPNSQESSYNAENILTTIEPDEENENAEVSRRRRALQNEGGSSLPIREMQEHLKKLVNGYLNASCISYLKFKKSKHRGYFHEKYHHFNSSLSGGGGEYENQVGFGWSNGVVIELVALYADLLEMDVCFRLS